MIDLMYSNKIEEFHSIWELSNNGGWKALTTLGYGNIPPTILPGLKGSIFLNLCSSKSVFFIATYGWILSLPLIAYEGMEERGLGGAPQGTHSFREEDLGDLDVGL